MGRGKMSEPKLFYIGDRVRIGKFPEQSYSAYKGMEGKRATIFGTYKTLCHGIHLEDRHQYALIVDGHGYSAWYDHWVLELVTEATLEECKKMQDMW